MRTHAAKSDEIASHPPSPFFSRHAPRVQTLTHLPLLGESFAAKHLECALAPASAKSLEEAAKALSA